MKNYIIEALEKLNEDIDGIEIIDAPIKPQNQLKPIKSQKTELVDNEINAKIISKIEQLSSALAIAFEKEGIYNIDPELIKQDMIRDCGLMGGIVNTDELDVEHNPFDAATKQMHDMGPVDTQVACNTLLNVPVDEFVNRIIMGLRHERGILPGPVAHHQLPHNNIRRLR